MQYTDTLANMVGFLVRVKPNLDPTLAQDYLNNRIRTVLDRKSFWAGTLKSGKIAIPAQYSTGSITITEGSTAVTGSGASWPTNDLVNTTVTAAISVAGLQTVTPASMAGITTDTLLYVDAAWTPEIVAVRETTATTFKAVFVSTHTTGFTLRASSFVGRQIRLSASSPIYTIRAVPSVTSLTLGDAWAGATASGQAYQIIKLYYTLSTDVRDILAVSDTTQGNSVSFHVSQRELNQIDPQRSATGDPRALVDYLPNENGNMQYEIYPVQITQRQLAYMYSSQWSAMRSPNDIPPPFINPGVIQDGALSDALRIRSTPEDPYYDPVGANFYEAKFERGVQDAINADESKALMAYSAHANILGGGANWAQSHAVSLEDYRW